MPSLSDTLESLSSRTSELAYLTTLNSRPAGKFTQAYLNLPSSSSSSSSGVRRNGNVLELIRDSNDGERRLFKFVGESNSLGEGGNKRVEKRENVLVTPLKQLKSHSQSYAGGKGKSVEGGGRDEVEIVLRTAMKLVDDYRPMPRARAHIANLLDSHHSSQERLIELERLIEEASKPISIPSTSTSTSITSEPAPSRESSIPDQPKLTPEEAIKAEEASLRALEASLIPLRRSSQANQSGSPPPSTRQLTSSPPPTKSTIQMQTPAKPAFGYPSQTPAREMPHVTNSLVVNGITPRRVDRFSPLKLITPREPLGPSGLGDSQRTGGAMGGRRSIFGRASIMGTHRVTSGSGSGTGSLGSSTSGPLSTPYNKMLSEAEARNQEYPSEQQSERAGAGLDEREEQDETIRIPRPASPPTLAPVVNTPSTPARPLDEPQGANTPKAGGAEKISEGNGGMAGIDLNNENVKAGIAKVWSTLGEMMRQGFKDGQTVNENVEASVKHLIHLSSSDLPSPSSPSSSSISSLSTAPNLGKPITSETILFSHLILSILKQPDGVDMNELKEHLGSIAKARNFDGASSNATKIIYAAVGKRMVRIDRKGGMVKVKFAD
ncbi:hypothetical protein L486_05030 [Kwoniella mangroviensis CBS 10435]|uniref:Uncharacterized protein n=1 Tax=Kwoniella mangroviensis CBS 10435 TaxID=1331196 RepID=A0A1B9IQ03_9TREE|nr:hypothetical protein L486_05030 [Kwoniella mangroviensis CBS 10435]